MEQKTFEAEGQWWIPGSSKKQLGVISIDFGKEILLKLYDFVERSNIEVLKEQETPFVNVMWGQSGREITLFKGTPVSGHTSTTYKKTLSSFTYAFIGKHFRTLDEIKFKDVVVYCSNVDKWLSERAINNKHFLKNVLDGKQEVEQISIFNNKIFNVSLVFGFDYSVNRDECKILKLNGISIEGVDNKEIMFKDVLGLISELAQFFSLMMNIPVFPMSIKGRTIENEEIEIYYRVSGYSPSIVKRSPITPTLNDVKSNINDMISKWLEFKKEEYEPAYDLISTITYHFYNENLYVLFTLLFETFNAYNKLNSEILTLGNINGAISYEAKIVMGIFEKYKNITRHELNISDITKDIPEINNTLKLANTISDLRNSLSHASFAGRNNPDYRITAKKVYRTPSAMDEVNCKMFHVLRILLLSDLGLNKDALNKEV
jgi:hypothetical protein